MATNISETTIVKSKSFERTFTWRIKNFEDIDRSYEYFIESSKIIVEDFPLSSSFKLAKVRKSSSSSVLEYKLIFSHECPLQTLVTVTLGATTYDRGNFHSKQHFDECDFYNIGEEYGCKINPKHYYNKEQKSHIFDLKINCTGFWTENDDSDISSLQVEEEKSEDQVENAAGAEISLPEKLVDVQSFAKEEGFVVVSTNEDKEEKLIDNNDTDNESIEFLGNKTMSEDETEFCQELDEQCTLGHNSLGCSSVAGDNEADESEKQILDEADESEKQILDEADESENENEDMDEADESEIMTEAAYQEVLEKTKKYAKVFNYLAPFFNQLEAANSFDKDDEESKANVTKFTNVLEKHTTIENFYDVLHFAKEKNSELIKDSVVKTFIVKQDYKKLSATEQWIELKADKDLYDEMIERILSKIMRKVTIIL